MGVIPGSMCSERRGFRSLLPSICTALAAMLLGCQSEPPNIVLLIGDDHGYPYYGFMGSETIKTPNLDELAREGVTFTHAFNTGSTCRPSLMTLLTGLYPQQWKQRVAELRRAGISRGAFREIQDFQTLPRLLRERGYVSFQGGKYWEGDFLQGGFTHGLKTKSPGKAGAKFRLRNAGGPSLRLGRKTMRPLWEFLDEFGGREPFFVWFAPMLPHTPFDPPASYLEMYAGQGFSKRSQAYYANISRFDDQVGRIVDYLDRHGLRENTVIIYLSDNGWQQNPKARHGAYGGPRGKWSMYELGFRTPLIFNWPGRLPRGVINPTPISTVDLFPTLLGFAGLPAPVDRRGRSLRPLFGGAPPLERRPVIMQADSFRRSGKIVRGAASGLRNERWHYIRQDSLEQLFAIDRDPEESHDVARDHPELLREFRADVARWRLDLGGTATGGDGRDPEEPPRGAGAGG